MRVAPLILIATAATLLASCGHRRPDRWNPNGGPVRNENYHGGPNAIILHYDANHDGTVTRAELEAGLHADFDALDIRHTGCLDKDQIEAVNQKRVRADRATASPLMDWNGDGCVDFNEFAMMARSLFMTLDRNNDGQITPQEFHPGLKGAKDAKDAGSNPAATGHHHHGQGGNTGDGS